MPTDSLLAVFGFSVAVSIGAVISPGPVSAAIITEAPRHGWRVGPLVASAHSLLELVIVVLIGFGLSSGLASPGISRVIALGGGIVLLGIGAGYIIGVFRGRMRLPRRDDSQPPRTTSNLLWLGLFTTLSNPFWYAWWVTVAAGYLAQAQSYGLAGPAVFYVAHASTDYAWDTLLSTAAGAGSRWFTDRIYQVLILVTGAAMAYFGIIFLKSGWPA
jgi:threonine/homoserine/homoserine lactone efflux protein